MEEVTRYEVIPQLGQDHMLVLQIFINIEYPVLPGTWGTRVRQSGPCDCEASDQVGNIVISAITQLHLGCNHDERNEKKQFGNKEIWPS